MISHEHECIFIHIPKCAGTSIEKALGLLPEGANFGMQDHRTLSDHQPLSIHHFLSQAGLGSVARRYRLRTHPNPQVRVPISKEQYLSYHKFTVVRNPWERVLSFYKGKFSTGTIETSQAHFCTFLKSGLGRGFLRSQLFWMKDARGEIMIDQIIRFENLGADWRELASSRRLPAELPHRLERSSGTYRHLYTPETVELVKEAFSDEIEYFGYRF